MSLDNVKNIVLVGSTFFTSIKAQAERVRSSPVKGALANPQSQPSSLFLSPWLVTLSVF